MGRDRDTTTHASDEGLQTRPLGFFGKARHGILNTLSFRWIPKIFYLPLMQLYVRRTLLQKSNLIHVPLPEETELAQRMAQQPTIPNEELPLHRTDDGYGNDGAHPAAGAQLFPIGRNMPIVPEGKRAPGANPDPQLVAQKLLARRPGPHSSYADGFVPAGMQLNVLAAAWIQTMVHDWIDHLIDPKQKVTFNKGAAVGCPMHKFRLSATKNDAGQEGDGPSTVYLNNRTGWWDASFLYGQTEEAVAQGRLGTAGKLHIAEDGIPTGTDGRPLVGDRANGWVGVAMLQDIFSREHNAVADQIAAESPELDDEGIFRKARLVVSAVVAKIHTIDWTCELLKDKTLYTGMNANWKGMWNQGAKVLGLVGAKKAENHGVPFNLTEEFAAVYRLHPLMPDTLPVQGASVDMTELLGDKGLSYIQSNGLYELWKSLVRYPCGALSLFNYPQSLRNLTPSNPDESPGAEKLEPVDLAVVDIYRDRERGIPRYNEFREWLGLRRFKSWKAMTGGDKYAISALQEVYGDDVDSCDLMVGNFAEKKIKGFAISETSFFIFLLMASRRLEADRFFTEHFTEEVYGKAGMKWVNDTKSMKDVLARHFPDIASDIPKNLSAFTPFEAMPHNTEAVASTSS